MGDYFHESIAIGKQTLHGSPKSIIVYTPSWWALQDLSSSSHFIAISATIVHDFWPSLLFPGAR